MHHKIHAEKALIPGQDFSLHLRSSIGNPSQGLPPLDIGGLSQERLLNWVPLPQDFEHLPKLLQLPQFPSTKKSALNLANIIFFVSKFCIFNLQTYYSILKTIQCYPKTLHCIHHHNNVTFH